MRRSGRAFSSFIFLAVFATCVACQPKPDANDPKPSETQAAEAAPSSSGPTPAANGPLAKLEGSRADVQDGAKEIAESGDEATKRAAAPILVKRIRAMREPAYRDELRPLLEKANEQSKLAPTPEQLEWQVRTYQDEIVVGLVKSAGKIGGPAITAYLVELAQDKEASRDVKQAALDALEPHRPSLDPSAVAAVDSAREALTKPPKGGVAVGGANVSEGTVANAAAVVASMAAGFRRCFNRGLQDDPKMKGTVRITAKIGKNGEVLSATPSGGETLSPTVVSCVAARVSSATFSPPEGGAATLVIPVSMTPE
jgi:hypothetical protein